jgi:hypothetical protein
MGSPAFNPNMGYEVPAFDPKASFEAQPAASITTPAPQGWRDKVIGYLSRPQESPTRMQGPTGSFEMPSEDNMSYLTRRALGGAAKVALHPIDTAMGIGNQIGTVMTAAAGEPTAIEELKGQAKSLWNSLKDDAAGTIADQMGQGAAVHGAIEGAGAIKDAAKPVVAKVLGKTSEAALAAGNKLINETVGSYKKDFNRGANPGRGYNEAIGGPSLSMRSLAYKAEQVKNQTGEAIRDVIRKSADQNQLIPINDVVEALNGPLKEQYNLETGPGGLGNVKPYEKYAQGFKDIIQKGIRQGGLSAQDVFNLKMSIARRTKWSNLTPEGIMDVRQGQVGALGGLLTERIPELKQLNQNFQDLVGLADRAAWRAESGSKPFGGLVREGAKATGAVGAGLTHNPAALAGAAAVYAADTVPGRTAIATGLYRAGKGMASMADQLSENPSAQIPQQAPPLPVMIRPIPGESIQDYLRRRSQKQSHR